MFKSFQESPETPSLLPHISSVFGQSSPKPDAVFLWSVGLGSLPPEEVPDLLTLSIQ